MTPYYSIYFAGELFDHKDLIGNALLALHIEKVSGGRYRCALPQDIELRTMEPEEIRNRDFKELLKCDLAIFNFDGTELDSGTVVEFMFAKFIDTPAVIVRSDFRSSGDQGSAGENWNLMCSFYPRTRTVGINAMEWYKKAKTGRKPLEKTFDELYSQAAALIIENLDVVRKEPSLLTNGDMSPEKIYQWALRVPGNSLTDLCSKPEFLENLISAKKKKGIY